MGAARRGDHEHRHLDEVGKPFHVLPLFQILTEGKNARRFDHLRRAEEGGTIITRPTAHHDQRGGISHHVRHLAAPSLNGVSGGLHHVGERGKFLAQDVRFFLPNLLP
jgi:hypothetical protein